MSSDELECVVQGLIEEYVSRFYRTWMCGEMEGRCEGE